MVAGVGFIVTVSMVRVIVVMEVNQVEGLVPGIIIMILLLHITCHIIVCLAPFTILLHAAFIHFHGVSGCSSVIPILLHWLISHMLPIHWCFCLCEPWCPQPCDLKWRRRSCIQVGGPKGIIVEGVHVLVMEGTILIYNDIL